jgi:pseudaminic acid biosynthesis-associated methylase
MNEQENFWANQYALSYINKNGSFDKQKGIKAWRLMLSKAENVESVLECGCNIGRNIELISSVLPAARKSIIEVSKAAYEVASKRYSLHEGFNGTIVDSNLNDKYDLVFTCGVLIHIHPDNLLENMKVMASYSNRYMLIAEYFNRTPVSLEYQGQKEKLFKSDFGKRFLENFNFNCIDYGFLWGHEFDVAGFDDITWWLFEKKNRD